MLITVLPAILTLSAPQQPPSTAEILPLQHICKETPQPRRLPWVSLLSRRSFRDMGVDFVYGEAGGDAVSPDVIVDALSGLMAETIDDRLYLQTIDRNLLAVGEADLVERTRDLIHEASQILGRPVQVELAVWDAASGDTPSTTLDANGYAEFVANRSPLWRAISSASAGRPVAMEHMTWSRYVRSIAIEIAQKKSVSNPVTDLYGEGGSANVRAFSLVGTDDFAVHMQFAIAARRGPIGALQTGTPPTADIELPQLDSYFGTCSGRIPNGGALAATMLGDSIGGGQITVTLRVSSTGQPMQLSDESVAIWPIGALVSHSLTKSSDLPVPTRQLDDVKFPDATGYHYIPSDNLLNLIESTLDASEGVNNIKLGAGHLFVQSSPGDIGRIEQLLLSLQQRMVQNAEIQHRAELQPDTPQTSQAASPVLHAMSIPTLLGREAAIYRLRETNVAIDVISEVASGAAAQYPHMQLLQSGTWFRACAIGLGESLHVNLDTLSAMAPLPPIRNVLLGAVLMQAKIATARNHHDGIVTPRRAISHGDGPRITLGDQTFKSTMSTTFVR